MILVLLLALTVVTSHTVTSQDIGYFWHVTDMHWDPTYVSSDVQPMSCGSANPSGVYSPYGDYRCDAPWSLINSSVYATRQLRQDVDFLIWTGDDSPHIYNDTLLNQDVVFTIISNLTEALTTVWPDRLVYSALGNHDWSPKHQLPPNADPLYDRIADLWQPWFDGDATADQTFRQGAYYSLPISASLRAIILNTNFYYENNLLTASMTDPAQQFVWLEQQLSLARTNGQKVMIIAHVPPGNFEKHDDKHWFYPHFNDAFIPLLTQYADVIGSTHMAHHHTDSYRIVHNSEGVAVGSIFLAPSVTPWETTLPGVMGGAGNNPGLRLVAYNRTSGHVLDILQYYQDLRKATGEGDTTWRLFYQATQYYNIPDMKPASLASLTERLLSDDALFSRYYNANSLGYDPTEVWTAEMRSVHYCAINNLNYTLYRQCTAGQITSFATISHPVAMVTTTIFAALCLFFSRL